MQALRPYQARAVAEVRSLWRAGKRSTVIVAPTGSGKTAIASEFIRLTLASGRARAYFLAHATELVAQPLHRLRAAGFRVGAIKSGWEADPGALVQVASTSTICRREVERVGGVALVIVDEFHHVRASVHEAVLAALRAAHDVVFLVGLTATPYRLDGLDLGDVADSLVELATPGELIDLGYLIDPVCYDAPKVDDDPSRPKLVGDVVETWKKLGGGLPTIGRAVNCAHARSIVDRFLAAGVPAAYIEGGHSEEERADIFARSAIGPTHPRGIAVLMTGGTMLEEGFDSAESYRHARRLYPGAPYDPLAVLIDAAPTSARAAWIQRLGRITRPYSAAQAAAEGVPIVREKLRATAIVHTQNLANHWFLRDHCGFTLRPGGGGRASSRVSPPASPHTCRGCLAVSPPRATACVGCGAPIVVGAANIPKESAGELRERAWSPPMAGAPEARQVDYLRRKRAEWRRVCADRVAAGKPPYKPGWVSAQFKMMFGVWPSAEVLKAAGE